MKTISANVTDVARNFSDYINRASYGGEHFVLIRGGKPVAEINPLPKKMTVMNLTEVMASLPKLPDNEIESMVKDLNDARNSTGKEDKNPWDV